MSSIEVLITFKISVYLAENKCQGLNLHSTKLIIIPSLHSQLTKANWKLPTVLSPLMIFLSTFASELYKSFYVTITTLEGREVVSQLQ